MIKMLHTVICNKCKSICEYDDKSIWEGNREHEDIACPNCVNIIGSIFTDQIPIVRCINVETKESSKF